MLICAKLPNSLHRDPSKLIRIAGSPRSKSTLLLTYEFLRLYVNAFAYQATISRDILSDPSRLCGPYRQLPAITAATPDARFIYESIEAAKSLLTTLTNFVDPETCLRYMPSRFYFFIIYSAVFLYKVSDRESYKVRVHV